MPWLRVGCPDIDLLVEPTRIIQAGRSDRDNVRGRVGFTMNWRAAFRAKSPVGLATHVAGRGMEA